MGQFANLRKYPTPSDKEVTAPNADTLYSSAWLDLSKEPDGPRASRTMKGRYYLMPMLSGWTDVFQVPGKRTTGTKAQKYAITGPGWKGTLPKGVEGAQVADRLVWILGRTYCTGTPEDYKAVHALQDQYLLVPLSAYGKPYTPPPGNGRPGRRHEDAGARAGEPHGRGDLLPLLAALLKDNPPAAADAPMVAKLAKHRHRPGPGLRRRPSSTPASPRAWRACPGPRRSGSWATSRTRARVVNGWMFSTKIGVYGTDYLQRAFITAVGLGANRPQDAVYPISEVDADGKPYDGANRT